MGSRAWDPWLCVCVCEDRGKQAPAEAAAERVLMFRENVVTRAKSRDPRKEESED